MRTFCSVPLFEWSHRRILSTDLKVRTTLQDSIVHSGNGRVNSITLGWCWLPFLKKERKQSKGRLLFKCWSDSFFCLLFFLSFFFSRFSMSENWNYPLMTKILWLFRNVKRCNLAICFSTSVSLTNVQIARAYFLLVHLPLILRLLSLSVQEVGWESKQSSSHNLSVYPFAFVECLLNYVLHSLD